MTEAPPATQTDRGVEAPPERASITPVRTSSTARIIGRVVIVGVFAMSATNAFSEAMNEARDILRHAPDPMPAVMLFQFAVALTSTLSALGTWRRTRWATRAIVAWGLVGGTFVALLQPLLDLPKDALPGLVAGAALDSHLRPRGKLAYVRALEAAVEPERARTVDIGLGPPRQYLGDLALFTLYKQFDTTRPIVTRTTPQTPPPASKPIVVLGDSQTETIQGEIAAGAISSFGFCSWDSSFFVGGCDEVFRGAGTIAVETVARAVWRRTEWGFGSRILGALLPIIPSKPAPWTHVVGAAIRPDHVSTLTVPHASFHLPAVRDNVDRLRAIRFTIDATAAGGAPVVQLLIDGKPSTEPLTSIANAPSHVELTLLVPRGTPISRTEVTVDSAPGAAVSPARISTLG